MKILVSVLCIGKYQKKSIGIGRVLEKVVSVHPYFIFGMQWYCNYFWYDKLIIILCHDWYMAIYHNMYYRKYVKK